MRFIDRILGRDKLDVSYGDASEGEMLFWKDRYGKLSELNYSTWTDSEVAENVLRISSTSRHLQSARYAARDRIMHLSVRVFYLEKELAAAAAPASSSDQKPVGFVRAEELAKFKQTTAGERGMMLYKAPIKDGVSLFSAPVAQREQVDQDEQEEFEKWARPHGYALARIHTGFRKGQYVNQPTRDAFIAFQAGRASIEVNTKESA